MPFEENEEQLMLVMGVIASAGEAKSLSFEALQACRSGDYTQADELLEQARQFANQAHDQHTRLLTLSAQGAIENVPFLMVHAADHLTAGDMAEAMAGEIIALYKEVRNV